MAMEQQVVIRWTRWSSRSSSSKRQRQTRVKSHLREIKVWS